MADEFDSMFATSTEDLISTFEETGNIGLDMALTNGKGVEVGSYVILTAGNGAGKSTTCLDLVKRILYRWRKSGIKDNKIVYIDIEGSKALAYNLGLGDYIEDGTLLYKGGPCHMSQLESICDGILEGKKRMIGTKYIFIDSITNLICEKEQNSTLDKGDYGNAVAARNKWYKKYLAALEKEGITIFGISQQRKKQQVMNSYEDPSKAAVADGDLHYADVIIKLSKTSGGNDAETKKKEVFNAATGKTDKISYQFKVTYSTYGDKNRYGHFPPVTTLMTYGKGCNNWFIMKTLLESFGYLKNAGSASSPKWNYSPELVSFVGKETCENLGKVDMKQYIVDNLLEIKDFLRSKDEFHIIKDTGNIEE